MTAAALSPSIEYLEDGATLNFAAPFRFLTGSLEVTRILADGTAIVLTPGSAWSATGGLTDAGGTVTLLASIAGARLQLRRVTPRAQQTDYTTADTFPAESHEAALDRAMLIDQEQDVQIADVIARSLQVPVGETIGDLPALALRIGKALEFDALGNPVPVAGAAASAAAAAASAVAAQAVLGQASAEADTAIAVMQNAVRINALRIAQGKNSYVVPETPPCLLRTGSVVWAAATAINSSYITADDRVYWQEKNGTSGATKPTSRDVYIIDNTLFLSFMGELAPVAYANSLTVVLGQRFYAGGLEFKVTVAGSFAGAGAGPATAADGTDGTVTYICLGPQTKPVVTCTGAALAGTTQQVAWNSPKVTILGGTIVQDGVNERGQVKSISNDGITLSGGSGKIAYRCDGPLVSFAYIFWLRANVWVDGELVAVVDDTSGGTSFLNLNFTGMPRKVRNIVFEVTEATKFVGVYATAFDAVSAYIPDNPVKAVLLGDSFAELRALHLSYTSRLAGLLGIEDFRISGIGATGLVNPGANVNYQTRFNADVLVHAPDFVFIQMTQNDANGIPGTWSVATVTTALNSLITQARAANIIPIVIGVWNSRGVPEATRVSINTEAQALCSTLGVAFVNWIDFLTDGGFVGTPVGSGNSLYYTEKDGVHSAFAGQEYRAYRLAPMCQAAIDLGSGYAGYGAIPSAAQVAAKVSRAGDTMGGKLNMLASDANTAGINLPPGVAPTVPVNGDIWATATALFRRLGAVTRQLATTDGVESLSGKTLIAPVVSDPVLIGTPIEDIFTITDAAAFEINPANGSIQLLTLGAPRTPKATNFLSGQAVTLEVVGTAHSLTWTDATFGGTGVKWLGASPGGGAAPALAATGKTVITLYKAEGQVSGQLAGYKA